MAKPEKVRYSGAAVMVDGMQMKRVQNFDASIDIGQDQVLELANSGIVQFIDQTPNVSISIDTNLYGSIDNAVLLTGKGVKKDVTSNIGTRRKGYYSHVLASSNASTLYVNETDFLNSYCNITVPILEGATAIARTMMIPRAAITGYSLNFDVGGLATENFTLQGNDKYWFTNYYRDVRVLKLTNYNIASSVLGVVTNSRIPIRTTAQGFVRLGTCMGMAGKSANGSGGTLPYVLSTVVGLICNEKIYLSTCVSGTGPGPGPFRFATAASMAPSGSGGVLYMSRGANAAYNNLSTPYVSPGDDAWLIFIPKVNQTWSGIAPATSSADPGYALVSTSGSYGGVSKGYIDAFLYNTDGPAAKTTSTTAGRTLRLQTVAIDISLTSETLDELGTYQSYAVVRTPPVPVNVTVTANDSDLEAFARLCASAMGITGSGTNILGTKDFSKANQLRVDVYKDKNKTQLLETVIVGRMSVQGDSYSVSVGGNAAQEITFLADNILLQGRGVAV